MYLADKFLTRMKMPCSFFWKNGHKKLSLKSKVELAADLVNEIIERYQKTL